MHRKQVSTNIRKTRDIVLLTLLFVAAIAAGAARAQTYTNLHSFAAGTDGADPTPIIRDEEGNIYGATRFGGIPSCNLDTCGTVFKIDSAGKETVLYRFEGGNNGSNPLAGLARDAKGNLYGTTQGNGYVGGASVVFKVDPQGHQTVLFVAGETAQGCCLDSPVAVDAHGNVYGMSPYGGKPNCGVAQNGLGCGTLFKIAPDGKFTVIHVFKEYSQREGWSLTPRATSTAPLSGAAISSAIIPAGGQAVDQDAEPSTSWSRAASSPSSTPSPARMMDRTLWA